MWQLSWRRRKWLKLEMSCLRSLVEGAYGISNDFLLLLKWFPVFKCKANVNTVSKYKGDASGVSASSNVLARGWGASNTQLTTKFDVWCHVTTTSLMLQICSGFPSQKGIIPISGDGLQLYHAIISNSLTKTSTFTFVSAMMGLRVIGWALFKVQQPCNNKWSGEKHWDSWTNIVDSKVNGTSSAMRFCL